MGGGSPACRRGSQELVLQGGHLSSPDAFCRKDFQPHKQALTRAGAETWPRRAAGPWVPGTAAEGRGSAGQRWPQAGSLGQDTASAPEPAGPSLRPQPGPGDQQTFCLSRVRGRDAGRVNVDTPERELLGPLGHGSAWRWPCGVVGRPRVQGWGRPPSRLRGWAGGARGPLAACLRPRPAPLVAVGPSRSWLLLRGTLHPRPRPSRRKAPSSTRRPRPGEDGDGDSFAHTALLPPAPSTAADLAWQPSSPPSWVPVTIPPQWAHAAPTRTSVCESRPPPSAPATRQPCVDVLQIRWTVMAGVDSSGSGPRWHAVPERLVAAPAPRPRLLLPKRRGTSRMHVSPRSGRHGGGRGSRTVSAPSPGPVRPAMLWCRPECRLILKDSSQQTCSISDKDRK